MGHVIRTIDNSVQSRPKSQINSEPIQPCFKARITCRYGSVAKIVRLEGQRRARDLAPRERSTARWEWSPSAAKATGSNAIPIIPLVLSFDLSVRNRVFNRRDDGLNDRLGRRNCRNLRLPASTEEPEPHGTQARAEEHERRWKRRSRGWV
jgi:hypothetical protein